MIWFLILTLAAGLIILAVVSKPRSGVGVTRNSKSSNRTGNLDKTLVAQRWTTIQAMSAGGGNGLRNAVSEADKLLDYALKHSGARGDTMGERLKSSGGRFSNLDSIWRAHKLRNALAHEVEYDLVPSQAKEAISDFERGLKDLGAL